ncbi:hypothetical protein evm_011607 [Chilo suppressalis]|nr:hypothetical protein evm_011607 [Chilo suppressalis]
MNSDRSRSGGVKILIFLSILKFGLNEGKTKKDYYKPPVTKDLPLLPRPIYGYELQNLSLDEPVLYFPQPFSYPNYPVILYL